MTRCAQVRTKFRNERLLEASRNELQPAIKDRIANQHDPTQNHDAALECVALRNELSRTCADLARAQMKLSKAEVSCSNTMCLFSIECFM